MPFIVQIEQLHSVTSPRSPCTRNRTGRSGSRLHRFRPSSISPVYDLQHLGARCGFELAGIHRHAEQAVVADGTGELDELVVAEARQHRLCCGIVGAMLAQQLPGEVDDLRVLRRDAARMVLADRGNGRCPARRAGARRRSERPRHTAPRTRARRSSRPARARACRASPRTAHTHRHARRVRASSGECRNIVNGPCTAPRLATIAVECRVVLGRDLFLAGDVGKSGHGGMLLFRADVVAR